MRMLGGNVWHVASAYVRERGRRQGVLKALLRDAIAEGRARGSERVSLEEVVSRLSMPPADVALTVVQLELGGVLGSVDGLLERR